jgi:hypothetical protein
MLKEVSALVIQLCVMFAFFPVVAFVIGEPLVLVPLIIAGVLFANRRG